MTEVGHGLCGWTEKWLVLSIKQSPGYTPLNSNDGTRTDYLTVV